MRWLGLLTLVVWTATAAAQPTFRKVAKTGDARPGGGTFTSFQLPVISENLDVSFIGSGGAVGVVGELDNVLTTFSTEGADNVNAKGGFVAWRAKDGSIWGRDANGVRKIIGPGDPISGGNDFFAADIAIPPLITESGYVGVVEASSQRFILIAPDGTKKFLTTEITHPSAPDFTMHAVPNTLHEDGTLTIYSNVVTFTGTPDVSDTPYVLQGPIDNLQIVRRAGDTHDIIAGLVAIGPDKALYLHYAYYTTGPDQSHYIVTRFLNGSTTELLHLVDGATQPISGGHQMSGLVSAAPAFVTDTGVLAAHATIETGYALVVYDSTWQTVLPEQGELLAVNELGDVLYRQSSFSAIWKRTRSGTTRIVGPGDSIDIDGTPIVIDSVDVVAAANGVGPPGSPTAMTSTGELTVRVTWPGSPSSNEAILSTVPAGPGDLTADVAVEGVHTTFEYDDGCGLCAGPEPTMINLTGIFVNKDGVATETARDFLTGTVTIRPAEAIKTIEEFSGVTSCEIQNSGYVVVCQIEVEAAINASASFYVRLKSYEPNGVPVNVEVAASRFTDPNLDDNTGYAPGQTQDSESCRVAGGPGNWLVVTTVLFLTLRRRRYATKPRD
jgi:hypothetical protein